MTLMPMNRMGGIFGRLGLPGMPQNPEQPWEPAQFPQSAPPQTVQPAMQAPNKLGKWATALEGVGSALRDDPGVFQSFQNRQAVMQQQQARHQQDLEEYARKVEDERNNWLFQQQYEAAHPKPTNNDTVADYNFYKSILPPGQFDTWLQNKIDPPQYRQGPDGQFYRISPTTPPPITAQDWESGQVIGGPSQPAAGNFPSGSPIWPGGR